MSVSILHPLSPDVKAPEKILLHLAETLLRRRVARVELGQLSNGERFLTVPSPDPILREELRRFAESAGLVFSAATIRRASRPDPPPIWRRGRRFFSAVRRMRGRRKAVAA